MSEPLSPAHVPEDQPNPVLVGPGLQALKDDAYSKATNATPCLDADTVNQMLESEAPSYFANIPGAYSSTTVPQDQTSIPVEVKRRASSGQDLLRRLSLAGDTPISPELDPRVEYPGLQLSGRLISAAFCIPYKLYHRAGSDWVSGEPCVGVVKRGLTSGIDAQAASRHISPVRLLFPPCFQ